MKEGSGLGTCLLGCEIELVQHRCGTPQFPLANKTFRQRVEHLVWFEKLYSSQVYMSHRRSMLYANLIFNLKISNMKIAVLYHLSLILH